VNLINEVTWSLLTWLSSLRNCFLVIFQRLCRLIIFQVDAISPGSLVWFSRTKIDTKNTSS
jgi:hypothetical protein